MRYFSFGAKALSSLVFFWAATPLTAFAAVSFTDSTFVTSDWTASKIIDTTATQNATFSISQQTSGGNPGSYQQDVLHWTSSGGASEGLYGASLDDIAAYNPAASGAITSISYSFDRVFTSAVGNTPGVFFSLGLFQNNSFYVTGNFESDNSNKNWMASSGSGLVASSFSRLTGSGPSSPDFSATGAPMTFGYVEGTGVGSAPGTVTITVGVDNFQVGIANVPEPATWVGALCCAGTLVIWGRRIFRGHLPFAR